MELKNKKIIFLGDSITQGVGASCVDNRYTDVFAKQAQCISLNYGLSGTRIARQTTSPLTEPWNQDFIMRAESMDKNADIIVIFGGTNDFGHGDARFGEMSDRDVFSFYGGLHTLFSYLLKTYPLAEIVVLTPLHRLSENSTINEIKIPCHPLIDYVNAIKEVASYYSLPILDLWSTAKMQPLVEENNKLYYSDGLHPSDLGHKRIAEKLYSFLKAL